MIYPDLVARTCGFVGVLGSLITLGLWDNPEFLITPQPSYAPLEVQITTLASGQDGNQSNTANTANTVSNQTVKTDHTAKTPHIETPETKARQELSHAPETEMPKIEPSHELHEVQVEPEQLIPASAPLKEPQPSDQPNQDKLSSTSINKQDKVENHPTRMETSKALPTAPAPTESQITKEKPAPAPQNAKSEKPQAKVTANTANTVKTANTANTAKTNPQTKAKATSNSKPTPNKNAHNTNTANTANTANWVNSANTANNQGKVSTSKTANTAITQGTNTAVAQQRLQSQVANLLVQEIKRKLRYPKNAVRRKLEGVVQVEFKVAQGKITGFRLSKSSGHKILDDAAAKLASGMVNMELPITANSTVVVVPIKYELL